MRYRFACTLMLLSNVALAPVAAGQQQPSPVMDMIEKAKNALNNLQYTQARTTAREVLALGKLKRSQEIAALQVASAAYYPDEASARMPDSAVIFLKRLVRMMPTGPFPTDLMSPGLDSQLVWARQTTFGASARAPLEVTIKGTEPRLAIDVMATRPARWQLLVISTEGVPPVLLDTLGSTPGGRLSLRAHNGNSVLIGPGDHEFYILGISSTSPDTITLKFDASVKGATPTLVDIPDAPDPKRLLPERSPRALGGGIAGGLIVGSATWAMANYARPPKALGDEAKDGRAVVVGIGIGLGSIAAGILDKGRPNRTNIKVNAATRADYLNRLAEATETNRKRINEYTLAITIDPEIK